jgi:hypothetical protein
MADTRYVTSNALLSPRRSGTLPFVLAVAGVLLLLLLLLWLLGTGSLRLLFLLLPALLLIPLLFLLDETPVHRRRGYEGEMLALEALNRLPEDYVVFNQVRIPQKKSKRGRECDYIVVGREASFAIEVKRLSGEVHLSNQGDCQILERNGAARPLKNPVLQNNNQRRALKDYLRRKGLRETVHPLLVFAGSSTLVFSEEMERSPLVNVIRVGSLPQTVLQLDERRGSGRSPRRSEVTAAVAGLVSSGQ